MHPLPRTVHGLRREKNWETLYWDSGRKPPQNSSERANRGEGAALGEVSA